MSYNKYLEKITECCKCGVKKYAKHSFMFEEIGKNFYCKPCFNKSVCIFPNCNNMRSRCQNNLYCNNYSIICFEHYPDNFCKKCFSYICDECSNKTIQKQIKCSQCNNKFCDMCNIIKHIDTSPLTLSKIGEYNKETFLISCYTDICIHCLGERSVEDFQLKLAKKMFEK